MTQSTIDLLKDAEHIFARIDEYEAAPESLDDILQLVDRYEPPASWILELPSQIKEGTTYKTLPIDVMEAAAKRIFGQQSGIETIGDPIIVQDKTGKFSVSVSVSYSLGNTYGYKCVTGIASVTSPNLHGLELATPKASTMAVKNALKQLGGLFGKYINRAEDQEELSIEPDEPKLTEEDLAKKLAACKTIDDLKSYRLIVYNKGLSPDIQSLYETLLRQFKTDKK